MMKLVENEINTVKLPKNSTNRKWKNPGSQYLRILLADRSPFFRMLSREILEKEFYIEVNVTSELDDIPNIVKEDKNWVIIAGSDLVNDQGEEWLKTTAFSNSRVFILREDKNVSFQSIRYFHKIDIFDRPESKNYQVFKSKLRALFERIIEEYNLGKIKKTISHIGGPDVKKIIILGGSTGGAKSVRSILKSVPADLNGSILIAQHMPGIFSRSFVKRLQDICSLDVVEIEEGTIIENSKVYIAPGGSHAVVNMYMGSKKRLQFNFEDDDEVYDCPSIDKLMKSVARNFEGEVIGIVLSGFGRDGIEGLKEIKDKNGIAIAQDKDSATIADMSRRAIDEGIIDKICTLDEIPQIIKRFCMFNSVAPVNTKSKSIYLA